MVVDAAMERWFADDPKRAQLRPQLRGPRPNCHNKTVFRTVATTSSTSVNDNAHIFTVAHYRARPLDGIWATAPFLHNGSVPTLHDLLAPQADRPSVFCVGDRQFDPKKVGLAASNDACKPGLTKFETQRMGNSNQGHSFEGTETDKRKLPRGVLGPGLSAEERDALLEYLKIL